MNGRVRHKKYRRRAYRRQNIGIIVLISAVALAAVLGTFLIIGNYLHDKSEAQKNGNIIETDTTENTTPKTDKRATRTIKGHPVLLETRDSSTLAERLDALLSKGVCDVSIPLNSKDGKLLYSSPTAKKVGVPTGTESIILEDASAYAKERNMFICGVYYITAFAESDPLIRSVELSKAAAVISEALNAGIDEVVIIAPQMTAEHVNEAIQLAEDIKALTDSGAVGLTVPDSIFLLEDTVRRSEIISQLNENIDFLSFDVSTIDNTAESIGETTAKEKLYLHMYKMRVLLPYTANENTQKAFIAAVEENGIENWQILKY